MNVLFVPFNYQNPFQPIAALFFHDQVQALVQSGVKVVVLSAVSVSLPNVVKCKGKGLGYRHWQDKGVDVYQFMFPAVPKAPRLNQWIRLQVQKFLYQKIKREHSAPDLVHVQMFPGGDFGQWMQKSFSIPYVVTEHLSGFSQGVYNGWQLQNAQSCYKHAQVRIAVSQHLATTLEQLTEQPFEVIPNCVDVSLFEPELDVGKKAIRRFIHVGRLDPIKNQAMLIEAFAKADLPEDCSLTIVGAGSEEANLRRIIDSLNIGDKVELYGEATKAEVIKLLSLHDAFVLASRYETFGVVLIEAMSMGLPVISTDCLGAREIITDDKVGEICSCDREALSQLLASFTSRYYDSRYIRQFAVEHFSNQSVANMINKVYSRIVR
ncbi:glycosyltransferase [Paraneptunicella aestuarii]|uniref:glycosyltransferase n=1 Tax=Paraneptunicella aestuarii TaxID=2831148 RepID=UPI001E443DB2|nr:glycosyltransferase [Paraneptunicella aestuarii]UAA39639.1 glycosyltransferase [Paraneptunicella aestuarii]